MAINIVLVCEERYFEIESVKEKAEKGGLELRFLNGFQISATDRPRVCAFLVNAEPITGEIMDCFPNLVTIARTGTGYDSVDIQAANKRGIIVSRVTRVAAEFVSEFVVGMILGLFRNIVHAHDRLVYHSEWKHPCNLSLHDATIGIIGLGHIGCRTAERLRAVGAKNLLGWNRTSRPFVLETAKRTELVMVSVEEVMAKSDAVVVTLALTPATRGLVSAERIGLMKPSSYLVNVARGAVVDETALVQAIKEKMIAGAALDVYSIEGQALCEQPFFLDLQRLAREGRNIILTPHFASSTMSATKMGITATMANIINVLKGNLEQVDIVTGM